MAGGQASLLVVEDDPDLAEQLRWALKDDYRLRLAGRCDEALEALRRSRPDLVLLDLCLPPGNSPDEGFRVLEAARAADTMVVVMSAVEERDPALRAIERGAYDFFAKPFDLTELRIVVRRALERQALDRENRLLRQQLRSESRLDGIVGSSPAITEVYEAVRRVADSAVTVTLYGESGTGKGVVARAIHYGSSRKNGPFVPVHCAALPETLLEAELFGHEKGAFTGASSARVGRFEAASGGTLFLDEVGCLTPPMQVKLLRVLDERAVERLGSNRSHPIDIRLIVATNEDLNAKMGRGELREDFYFRIQVFPIRLPALRERGEDVAELASHFLKRVCQDRGLPPKRLSETARQELLSRRWPGNVRELRNLIETLALLVDDDTVDAEHIRRCPAQPGAPAPRSDMTGRGFKVAVEDYERQILVGAIRDAGGVKAEAARRLKLDPGQMKYLVRKYDL